jgi:hypothetical protein
MSRGPSRYVNFHWWEWLILPGTTTGPRLPDPLLFLSVLVHGLHGLGVLTDEPLYLVRPAREVLPRERFERLLVALRGPEQRDGPVRRPVRLEKPRRLVELGLWEELDSSADGEELRVVFFAWGRHGERFGDGSSDGGGEVGHILFYAERAETSGFARGSVDLPGRAVSEGMKNLGKLLGSTGVVTSMGVAQTPVNFTIKGWEHVVLQSGADTIEIEYETDSRSSRITSLRHNGAEIDAVAWDDRIWACEGRTVEYTACAPEGFPAWTEHLEEGPSGLCNLACAARERAIQSLVEAAGGEYDEENAGYGYELDNEGNLVSTDEAA